MESLKSDVSKLDIKLDKVLQEIEKLSANFENVRNQKLLQTDLKTDFDFPLTEISEIRRLENFLSDEHNFGIMVKRKYKIIHFC